MKKLLFFLLLLPSRIYAQDSLLYDIFPTINGKIYYEKVIYVDSVNKYDLFIRAKEWALENYSSQKATNQVDDKDDGFIAYTGYFEKPFEGKMKRTPILDNRQIWNTVRFYIKDGKVKVVINDIKVKCHIYAYSTFAGSSSDWQGQAWHIEDYASRYEEQYPAWFKQNITYFGSVNEDFLNMIAGIERALKTKTKSDF